LNSGVNTLRVTFFFVVSISFLLFFLRKKVSS